MLRPSLQSLFAVCAFFSVAFANALPNNGPAKYETVVVYETITTCITTSSVYTISAPATTCSLSSSGVIIPPSPPPSKSTSALSQEYTASTVYITTVKTVTSCASTVQSCPATEATHTYVVTDTISSYVTTCPVTTTQTPAGPSFSSYPVSPSPSPSTSVSKSYSETESYGPTGPSFSASASPSASVSKSYSETKSYGPSGPSSSASASPTYPVSTSTVSSVSSVATYQPTSSSTLSPSVSSSVTASASYTTASSSSAVSSSYSVSSSSTSSAVGSPSSSPTYSASKSTSSTVSVPTSSSSKTLTTSSSTPTPTACSYWMENIKHQGIAPFAGSGYQVFRNVKDAAYGAKGDGVTDDTAAIQKAISTGSNCPPDGTCQSSSTTSALIYFPPGTYIISTPVLMHYGSSLIGNPNCPPVLKAKSTFPIPGNPNYSTYIVDGNAYGNTGNLAYGATNTFWRQFRNFVLDTTAVRANANILGLHWPTAQATSVENVVFKASDAPGTTQGGMLSEQGSGGFMGNLTFYGGSRGLDVANQQFTMRNLNFHNAGVAIKQNFNWGWVYKGISITNCSVGIQFEASADGQVGVSSLTLIDSSIVNTPVGISLQRANEDPTTPSVESLIIENLSLTNVPTAIGILGGTTLLAGTTGTSNIAGWGRGPSYTATGHTRIQGNITPATRPGVLKTSTGEFYQRSKPQYETSQASSFVSVRSFGAKGDGVTDDTAALTSAINSALSSGSILFVDAGYYIVSSTIYIPPGSKITGEGYPIILASGPAFTDINNPTAVVRVGKSGGEKGTVEWSNMIVSTKGAAAGAILIEWNLDATGLAPAGMWDVHTRIGGFAGSDLQLAQCPTGTFDSRNGNVTMTSANLPQKCIAAFMSMHVTKYAAGLYMENVWLWVADHDVDDATVTQITVFAGRGLLVESTAGSIWMYGTSVEHHALYQYQLANTANIYMGEIQTETPYYQPNPNTAIPFPAVASLNDPATASDAVGLRILSSNNILVYGAGLYSFFYNYNVHCSDAGNGDWCQPRIFSVEKSSDITVYGLQTVGTQNMITVDGNDVASSADNVGGQHFVDTIVKFTQ